MDAFYTENIVTEKYGYNMTINLYQDIDAPNPFDEFDTLGTLETFTSVGNELNNLIRNGLSLLRGQR